MMDVEIPFDKSQNVVKACGPSLWLPHKQSLDASYKACSSTYKREGSAERNLIYVAESSSKQFPFCCEQKGDYSSKRWRTVQYLTKLFVLFGGKRLMNRLDWHFQQEGHWSGGLQKTLIVRVTLKIIDDSEEICMLSPHMYAHTLGHKQTHKSKGQTQNFITQFVSPFRCYEGTD